MRDASNLCSVMYTTLLALRISISLSLILSPVQGGVTTYVAFVHCVVGVNFIYIILFNLFPVQGG